MVLKSTVGFNSTFRSVCSDRLRKKALSRSWNQRFFPEPPQLVRCYCKPFHIVFPPCKVSILLIIHLIRLYDHLNGHCYQLLELLKFVMATDLFHMPHCFFRIVFLCVYTRLVLYHNLSLCWKLIYLKLLFHNLLICNLCLSLFVYFIVLLMRLEAFLRLFALGALQMSYYYKFDVLLHERIPRSDYNSGESQWSCLQLGLMVFLPLIQAPLKRGTPSEVSCSPRKKQK